MKSGNAFLREEIARLREDMHSNLALWRTGIGAVEKRSVDRIDRVYDAVNMADSTRRNAEVEADREQSRQAGQLPDPQQH